MICRMGSLVAEWARHSAWVRGRTSPNGLEGQRLKLRAHSAAEWARRTAEWARLSPNGLACRRMGSNCKLAEWARERQKHVFEGLFWNMLPHFWVGGSQDASQSVQKLA